MKFYGPAIVTVVHGESNTLYSVTDTGAPEPEQPAVIRTFGTQQHGLYAHGTAQFMCDLLNDLEKMPSNHECKRCGTPLSDGGRCGDETCPYYDRQQSEPFTEG